MESELYQVTSPNFETIPPQSPQPPQLPQGPHRRLPQGQAALLHSRAPGSHERPPSDLIGMGMVTSQSGVHPMPSHTISFLPAKESTSIV